ncbi:type II toxin-antitoxin system prevent-host-death family antitoxin [Candidatus Desantisbacteria bacterium]|nr:type II toxin-antitoxin system prevent-host-death family antitoxin [Candidatus Desantisbacteria bacterium]
MLKSINIHEAKTNFFFFLKRAENGEEIIISKAGHPIAKIISIKNKKIRKFGTAKGKVIIHDNFNTPLPDDIMDAYSNQSC